MIYILDTDHVSLLQRGNRHVISRLSQVDLAERAVTIITVAEQTQGRLAVIRRAKTEQDTARALEFLQKTVTFYREILVLPYNTQAQAYFTAFRHQKIRIGTQDLRIASIVLSNQAILVTRNQRDFIQVPGLIIEDWSRYRL
jgi:tRNA(fMet)-specific endonuclease VapC